MRDPHVVRLFYSITHRADTSFADPPAVSADTPSFEARLEDGILTVTMLAHFSEIADARALLDPYLEAWHLQEELLGGRTGIRFVYKDAEVVDRDPPPPGTRNVILAELTSVGVAGASATLHVVKRTYPLPPDHFALDPDVESMWFRFVGHKEGREPLPGMAYFCLTVLRATAGGERQAAAAYEIDRDVLRKIGELSSTRGDLTVARKAERIGSPLSEREKTWLDSAVRLLIARAAEIAGGKKVTRISMADLPKL
jgi:hypothetical protein